MRKLMWFTLGFGAACALGTYLLRGNGILILAAAALVVAIGAIFGRQHLWIKGGGLVAFGVGAGCLLFWLYSLAVLGPAAQLDGKTVSVLLHVTDYSWETDYGTAVDGTIQLEGNDYKIRFYFNEKLDLQPGDTVRTSAKLRLTDEGGAKEPTFHRTNGIFLLGYQRGEEAAVQAGETTWKHFPAQLRRSILGMIEQFFSWDTVGFAKALLLGDKTGLTHAQATDFSVTGISHVVAVSGLHVSILFSLIYPLAGKKRFLTALLGIPCLLLFGAMTGFTPSVTRAVVMQILMILALAMNREYDPPTALAFACLVMLIENPLVIASVGFQLSVGSVAGIFLFAGKIRNWLKERLVGKKRTLGTKMLNWLISGVSVTLGAMFFTTPLVAVYYGTVSLVGILTNLLVLWVISFIFYGIMLACLLGAFSAGAGWAVAWVIGWLIRYVLTVADVLAAFPLAAVYTASPYVVLWLMFVYGLIACLLGMKEKRPVLLSALASAGLCVVLLVSWMEPLLCGYRVTVLDVGQGQCVLLQSGGYTYMVDCGGDYDPDAGDLAAMTLLSMGVSRLDGLILTHYDRDHAGGVAYLSERVDLGTVYLPKTEDTDGTLGEIVNVTPADRRFYLDTDLTLTFNGVSIEIFAPKSGDSGNESCAVVLFRSEKCDTLITGDIAAFRERQLLAEHDIPDLELLIVGHHGSKYSTCQELLDATAPDVAVISVGADNSYGHPTQEVLDRLEQSGCVVYRTDHHGTIVYKG